MVDGVLFGEDGHSLDTRRPDGVNTGGRCDDSENRGKKMCKFIKHHRLIFKMKINVLQGCL
jgi:hypothetical protein